MARPVLRITPRDLAVDKVLHEEQGPGLRTWLQLSKTDLEYKIRHSKSEETAVLQGALRVLDDLEEIING